MFTSRFSEIVHIKMRGLTPVSIAQHNPFDYHGRTYYPLCPPKDLLYKFKNKEITKEIYTNEYIENVLLKLEANETYADLLHQYNEDAVLLCYEGPNEFCHRRIVAEWFGLYTQHNIREFNYLNYSHCGSATNPDFFY